MSPSDTHLAFTVLAGVLIGFGIIGVFIPMVPGLLLAWVGAVVWAIFGGGGTAGWVVFVGATIAALFGAMAKYALPGRNLRRASVPTRSIIVGGVLGIIGFFVIPVVGLPLGFVLGILIAERVRQPDWRLAWRSTVAALKAVGLSILIEIFAGMIIAVIWVVGLLTS